MTPELFNMIGGLLLLVCGVVLFAFGMVRLSSRDDLDDLAGVLIVTGGVMASFGMMIVVACWEPLGQSLFGGGR